MTQQMTQIKDRLLWFFAILCLFLSASSYGLDATPDAVMITDSLATLPSDLIQNSTFKTILTEDFAFYYGDNEDRLSLNGLFKRLAYEHDLTAFDQVMAYVLNQPAQLAFWKAENGKLDHFLVSVDKKGLNAAIAKVLQIVSERDSEKKDTQVTSTETKNVYSLRLNPRRSFFFTMTDQKLLFFSDLNVPYQSMKESVPLAQTFEASPSKTKHTLYFSMKYLSFGYQYFFPQYEALKMNYDGKEWKMAAKVLPATISNSTAKVTSVLPAFPAFCALLPIDSDHAGKAFAGLPSKEWLGLLEKQVGACWYSQSRADTPLIIAKTVDGKVTEKQIQDAFEYSIKGLEKDKKVLPLTTKKEKLGTSWSRKISAPSGSYEATEENAELRYSHYFNPKASLANGYLIFSIDDKLVDKALLVMGKKFPAMGDSLKEVSGDGFYFHPKSLSELVKKTALSQAEKDGETVFLQSLKKHFVPALGKTATLKPQYLQLPTAGKEAKWEDVSWHSL